MATTKIKVHAKAGTYSIYVGSDLVTRMKNYLADISSRNAFIISDKRLTNARQKLKASLARGGWKIVEIPVTAGEELKNFKSILPIYAQLLKHNARRDSVIFALGGGSVGDAIGFVASTYLRGIAWVGVPTTLLAQVDSSIGGKTAVNHPVGKNLIGSFHQPIGVFCDVGLLKSLSQREMISGLGETLKYGLVYDASFFNFVVNNFTSILKHDEKVLIAVVKKCASFKASAVSRDEFDKNGMREALNLGHTFGHALETITSYRKFQHGEAVIWGMRFALALSEVRGHMACEMRKTFDEKLIKIPVPGLPKLRRKAQYFAPMSKDKKVRGGKLHFVLLKRPGHPVSDHQVTLSDMTEAFDLMMNGHQE